jgi:hypothetical protein
MEKAYVYFFGWLSQTNIYIFYSSVSVVSGEGEKCRKWQEKTFECDGNVLCLALDGYANAYKYLHLTYMHLILCMSIKLHEKAR